MFKIGDICKCSTNPYFLYKIIKINTSDSVQVQDIARITRSGNHNMYGNSPAQYGFHNASYDIFTPIQPTKLQLIVWGINEKL